jgi:hypothetical protein
VRLEPLLAAVVPFSSFRLSGFSALATFMKKQLATAVAVKPRPHTKRWLAGFRLIAETPSASKPFDAASPSPCRGEGLRGNCVSARIVSPVVNAKRMAEAPASSVLA